MRAGSGLKLPKVRQACNYAPAAPRIANNVGLCASDYRAQPLADKGGENRAL